MTNDDHPQDDNRIDLSSLSMQELERMKIILDLQKIQSDIELTRQTIEQTRQSINESQARARHFDTDIEQIRQSINESQARARQSDATLEQIRATTAKIEKENRFFPFLTIITAMMTGGMAVALLHYFLA